MRICTAEVTRLPGLDIFRGVRSRQARVAVLFDELFAYYDRHPTLWRARCEQDQVRVLAEFAVHRSLIDSGLTTTQAAAKIADVVNRWLQRSRKESGHED